MSSEMVERIATILATNCSDCKKLGDGKPQIKAHLEDARHAIAAMREPTEK